MQILPEGGLCMQILPEGGLCMQIPPWCDRAAGSHLCCRWNTTGPNLRVQAVEFVWKEHYPIYGLFKNHSRFNFNIFVPTALLKPKNILVCHFCGQIWQGIAFQSCIICVFWLARSKGFFFNLFFIGSRKTGLSFVRNWVVSMFSSFVRIWVWVLSQWTAYTVRQWIFWASAQLSTAARTFYHNFSIFHKYLLTPRTYGLFF